MISIKVQLNFFRCDKVDLEPHLWQIFPSSFSFGEHRHMAFLQSCENKERICKINRNGCFTGNPGKAGFNRVFRDDKGNWLASLHEGFKAKRGLFSILKQELTCVEVERSDRGKDLDKSNSFVGHNLEEENKVRSRSCGQHRSQTR